MSTILGCGNCDRPVQDGAAICSTCTTALAEALRGVPELIDDLLITMAKQDGLATGGGTGRNEQPLPCRLDIPDEIWTLGNTLTTWARDVAAVAGLRVDARHLTRPVLGAAGDVATSDGDSLTSPRCPASELPPEMCAHCRGDRLPAELQPDTHVTMLRQPVAPVLGWRPPTALDSVRFAAAWLRQHLAHLRRLAAAEQAFDEITYAIRSANQACSAPPLRLFAGPCDTCEADLYGWPDHRAVRCPRCDTKYTDMAERWDRALLRLRGYPATAALIAGAIGELYGQQVNRKRINDWHYRGTLRKVDDDPDTGDPRFRIGEVLDRAKRSEPRKVAT